MEILSLNPEGFRNLAGGRIEFHPRLNLVVGDNGQGKTNLARGPRRRDGADLVSDRGSFRGHPGRGDARPADRQGPAGRVGPRGPGRAPRRAVRARRPRAVLERGAGFAPPGEPARPRGLPDGAGPDALRGTADRTAARARPGRAGARSGLRPGASGATRRPGAQRRGSSSARSRFDADELAVYEETMAESGARVAAARREALSAVARLLIENATRLRSPFGDLRLDLASDLPAEGDVGTIREAFRARLAECAGRRAPRRALPRRPPPGRRRPDERRRAGGRARLLRREPDPRPRLDSRRDVPRRRCRRDRSGARLRRLRLGVGSRRPGGLCRDASRRTRRSS